MASWAPTLTFEQRVAQVRQDVFSEADGTISVFRVETARDVARVAMAMNRARNVISRNSGEVDLLAELIFGAITADEIGGLPMAQTTVSFICHWAGANHWNLSLTPQGEQRLALAFAPRKPKRVSKAMLNIAKQAMQGEGCFSVDPQSAGCICQS